VWRNKFLAGCRARGTREIVGEALPQNAPVIGLVKKLGFTVGSVDEDEGVRKFRLPLR
jgi:acetyltransferase